jgi:hypothetical protein
MTMWLFSGDVPNQPIPLVAPIPVPGCDGGTLEVDGVAVIGGGALCRCCTTVAGAG